MSGLIPKLPLALLALLVFSGPAQGVSEPAADREDLHTISAGFGEEIRDDPSRDGWETEAFVLNAEKQLGRLEEILLHPDKIVPAHVKELVTERFTCDPLVPKKLRAVFSDRAVTVFRAELLPSDSRSGEPVRGLVAALRDLVSQFQAAEEQSWAKFKLFRVKKAGATVHTRQYLELAGQTRAGRLVQNAVWTIRWVQPSGGELPKIEHIQVDEYERVLAHSAEATLFADCTYSVLGHNRSFGQQLMHGTNHWLRRIQTGLGSDLYGHQGLAVGDVNGDGLEDVYLCQPGGLPNRLFVQNPDGTASDASQSAGVDFLDLSHGALLIDIDNDGDQDLVLSLAQEVLLMANDGGGRFTERLRMSLRGVPTSLAAADYDLDGDLDIYACVYFAVGSNKTLTGIGTPVPYHDANNGGANALLRNQGDWQFKDVTDEVGMGQNNSRFSFAASWEDYDNDNDLDLYVANDYGRNNLYRNDRGTFVDVAAEAGVEDIGAGMGVTWGDYNRDGLMDLYVANMFSSAGNRISHQQRFQAQASGSTKAHFQRHARGNSLFENTGDGGFRDVSLDAGVTMGRWAWASRFLDINNDGWEDLLVANGYVSNQKIDDL